MMDWEQLLRPTRLGSSDIEPISSDRSPYETDIDRIMFSSAFRRLADKTQVHGRTGTDYVRSRLTHSLEVSRVARSLGAMAGRVVVDRHLASSDITGHTISHIVQAAALLHDLGNLPFGHHGEEVISDWFHSTEMGTHIRAGLPDQVATEMMNFEGNAQGFRLVSRLQGWREDDGLELTSPTLATSAKYPRIIDDTIANPVGAKYSYFASERHLFDQVARNVGLLPKNGNGWCRHPLAHLLEAADDISYIPIDIEDGAKLGCLTESEAEDMLRTLAGRDATDTGIRDDRRLVRLRSLAIQRLITDAVAAFLDNERQILAGEFPDGLIKQSPIHGQIRHILEISRDRIYHNEKRLRQDLRCERILRNLLEGYGRAFLEWETSPARPTARTDTIIRTLPGAKDLPRDRETWVRFMMDHISGMTDGFAMSTEEVISA